MKSRIFIFSLIIFAGFSLSCGMLSGVTNLIGGTSSSAPISDLWSDVPRIDGLNKSNIDLPITAKLAIQAFVKTSSKGEGSLDFIAFTTTKTTQDLSDFYTLDKMSTAGWSSPDQAGCQTGSGNDKIPSGGLVCFFSKESPDKSNSILIIFATQDVKSNETQVFFARMDLSNVPTPTG